MSGRIMMKKAARIKDEDDFAKSQNHKKRINKQINLTPSDCVLNLVIGVGQYLFQRFIRCHFLAQGYQEIMQENN